MMHGKGEDVWQVILSIVTVLVIGTLVAISIAAWLTYLV